MKSILMVLFFAVIFSLPANAKKRIEPIGLAPYQIDDRYPAWRNGTPHIRAEPTVRKPHHPARRAHRRIIRQVAPSYRANRGMANTARFLSDAGTAIATPFGVTIKAIGVSLAGVVSPLAAKAQEICSACGSKVISAVSHRYVRGSGRLSLHASGRAVDITGNPGCIYAHLRGWPGGVSTDYATIRPNHVHISYSPNGREWGLRFAHYRGGKHRRHYARRHHRYALK